MKPRSAPSEPRRAQRFAATAWIAAAAIAALWSLSIVFDNIALNRSTRDALGRLDRSIADLHADLRTRVGSGDSIALQMKSAEAIVGRTLDSLRSPALSRAQLMRPVFVSSAMARVSASLTPAPDADAVARAYSAWAAEAVRSVETALTEDTPDAGRLFDLRFLALRQALAAVSETAARHEERLLAGVDVAAYLVISIGALTLVRGLWRRKPTTGPRSTAGHNSLPELSHPVALIDRKGVIQRAGDFTDRVFGRSPETLPGTSVTSLVHADDCAAVTQFLARCSKDPKTTTAVDFRPRHATGVWFSMEAVSGRRKNDPVVDGSIVRFVDVTARKSAEDALKQSNELVRALVEGSPLAIIIEDEGGRVRLWNGAAERMFGWPANQVLGRSNPTIPEESVEERRNLRSRVLNGQAFTGLESQRLKHDGTLIETSVTTAPLDRPGESRGDLMEVIADITDRKELEAQLRGAQKMEAIGRLAGGIAHDFNNLLTAINGYVDLLLQMPALTDPAGAEGATAKIPSAIRENIEQIGRAGERAAGLTQQLLAFSRSQVLQPVQLDLNSAVSELDSILQRLLGEDIDLAIIPGADLESIKADPTQISQVIMNLALNARDAMPAGGRLTIETSNVELDEVYSRKHVPVVPGPYVMLAVSDTGLGMDRETQSRVFEPFFTTKEKGKGTGLGLATVYGIVRQSGGYIWVYSEVGHGTSFKVYLPSAERRSGVEEVVDRPSRPPANGTETVLLVEDEEMVRTLVRQVLTWYGYNVIDAHNGEEALRVAGGYDGTIDLMLTDIVMPGMSALDLVERLATIRPSTKVLYMSGYTDHAVVRNNLMNSNRAFLQKPFAPDRLAHKIRELLNQDGGGQPRRTNSGASRSEQRAAIVS